MKNPLNRIRRASRSILSSFGGTSEKKIKGITFDGSPTPPCTIPFPVYSKNRFQIGNITSSIYSPFLKTNIGLSMVDRDYWNDGQDVIVLTPDNIERKGKVCSLPFNYS